MGKPTRSVKEEDLRALAEQPPADAAWKDVAYEAYVGQEIEAGLAEAKRGDFAGEDEVWDAFAKWGRSEVGARRTRCALRQFNRAQDHVRSRRV